jgi:hypothetical protein
LYYFRALPPSRVVCILSVRVKESEWRDVLLALWYRRSVGTVVLAKFIWDAGFFIFAGTGFCFSSELVSKDLC